MESNGQIKRYWLKAMVAMLGLLIVAVAAYLIFLPLYPQIKYLFLSGQTPKEILVETEGEKTAEQNATSSVAADTNKNASSTENFLPKVVKPVNRLIIEKIGVNIPIIESENANWALNRGAWRMPETSTPDKGSNTVITGHRFKYLPPNNLTFYLLDKLVAGDILKVIWSEKTYLYKVTETKIVPPTEVSVLDPSEKPILTLLTCDPIFSQKNRLIVIGELVEQ